MKTAASKLAKYSLDLVAVQEVRLDEDGSQPADDYTLFCGNGKANHHLGKGPFVHKGIISVVRTVEFISDKISYITLKGRWCDVIFLSLHAPIDHKDSFTRN
jgi:hypothetical protein